jgi:hypothetical protein
MLSMRRRLAALAFSLLAANLACSTISQTFQSPTPVGDPARQATVDALLALTGGLEFPKHFQEDNPVRTRDEFDANRYFEVLDHLSMEPGYTLDYVYQFDGLGGYPVLYARPLDAAPFATFSDYSQAAPDDYLDHVQTDDTEEGFFQLAVLRVMGGQFYLYWHAAYFDHEVVADAASLEALITETEEFCGEWESQARRQARALAVAPHVETTADQVTVKAVVFSKWRGFSSRSYTFARSIPHQLLDSAEEVLAEYECNVVF